MAVKGRKEKMEIVNSFRRSRLMGSPCQACYVVKSDDFFDVNLQCQNKSAEVTRSSAVCGCRVRNPKCETELRRHPCPSVSPLWEKKSAKQLETQGFNSMSQ